MKINFHHYTLIFFAIITVFAAAAGYILLYRVVTNQVGQTSQAFAQITVENQKKLHEQELTAMYADTADDRARIGTVIISQDKVVNFIEAVEGVGNNSDTDLQMSTINTEKAVSGDTVVSMHILAQVDITGSWSNVMRALTLLQNMPYSVTLSNVVIQTASDAAVANPAKGAAKGAPKENQWELTVDLKALTM